MSSKRTDRRDFAVRWMTSSPQVSYRFANQESSRRRQQATPKGASAPDMAQAKRNPKRGRGAPATVGGLLVVELQGSRSICGWARAVIRGGLAPDTLVEFVRNGTPVFDRPHTLEFWADRRVSDGQFKWHPGRSQGRSKAP